MRERGIALRALESVDARSLDFADSSAGALLLLGPLYHLTEGKDRRTALHEAWRVLRPGGWLFAAAISRYASLVDGLRGPVFDDEAVARIVDRDLTDGQHRNDTDNPLYFTTAFFHRPDELSAEVQAAGFRLEGLHSVEGLGAFIPRFADRWSECEEPGAPARAPSPSGGRAGAAGHKPSPAGGRPEGVSRVLLPKGGHLHLATRAGTVAGESSSTAAARRAVARTRPRRPRASRLR